MKKMNRTIETHGIPQSIIRVLEEKKEKGTERSVMKCQISR
jgi:hypothetical protein